VADPDDGTYTRAPEPEDVVRICRALNEAGARYVLIEGFAVIAHGAGRFTKDIVVRVADEVIVDLMGRACGLSYSDGVMDAEEIDLGGVMVPVASPRTLIRTKDTKRPQDAIDRAFLEGVIREREARR
jgi:hypothetical protein